MKIVAITSELPYPPNYGGARLRQYELLKRLASKHEVHLITFWETEEDRELTPELENTFASIHAMMKPEPRAPNFSDRFKVSYWRLTWSQAMQALIEQRIQTLKPNVIYLTPAHMAFYADHLQKVPAWIDATDSGELHAASNLAVATGLKAKIQGTLRLNAIKQYEQTWYPKYQGASFVAQPDADAAQRLCRNLPIQVIENGVDTDYFAPIEGIKKKKKVVFTGTMDFSPNIDAVQWFCQSIFPKLREKHTDIEFDIIGRVPTNEVKALGDLPGVNVHGFVPDLRTSVQEASVYVCPMRKGAGMKNKLLEAMAMQMPIVSTVAGAQGIGIEHGREAQLCQSASDFIEATLMLLENPTTGNDMGIAGRNYVLKHHCWDHSAAQLEEGLTQLMN